MSCGHVEIKDSSCSVMGPVFPEPFALISITAFIPDLATNDPFMSFPASFRTLNYESYDRFCMRMLFKGL